MKVKSVSEVAQSCPTLSDPMDCNLPGSSMHGIFQARVLEWGAIAFSTEMFNDQHSWLSNVILFSSFSSETNSSPQSLGLHLPQVVFIGL